MQNPTDDYLNQQYEKRKQMYMAQDRNQLSRTPGIEDLVGVSQDNISCNTSMVADGLSQDKMKMNVHSQQVLTNTPGFNMKNVQQLPNGIMKQSRNQYSNL